MGRFLGGVDRSVEVLELRGESHAHLKRICHHNVLRLDSTNWIDIGGTRHGKALVRNCSV